MTVVPSLKRPEIAKNVHLDDRWATKIVGDMLAVLKSDRDSSLDRYEVAMQDATAGLGNPRGQRRVYEKMLAGAGNLLLSAYIRTGKRKYFVIDICEGIPCSGGLVGVLTRIQGLGPGRRCYANAMPNIFLSRHALVRLVQRCDCKTAEDLVLSLRAFWYHAMVICAASEGGKLLPETGRGWIMPINTQASGFMGVPLLRGRAGDDPAPLIVPTVLAPEMVSQSMMTEIDAEIMRLLRLDDDGGLSFKEQHAHLVELMKASTQACHGDV